MRQWLRAHVIYASAPARLALLGAILVASSGLVALGSASTARSRGSRVERRAETAKPVHCGDTITTDTTLHHNLANCSKDALVIGADNVTLDLNYHTIDGDETSTKDICDCAVVDDGHDGVTVVNGSVRGFDGGVGVVNARHVRVLGISASRNEFTGFFFFRDTRSLVRNSSGNGSLRHRGGTGLTLIDSHQVRVVNNSFRNNGDVRNRDGHGIFLGDSSHNLIKGNRTSGNPGGIIAEGKSNRNELRRNRSARESVGIDVDETNGNVLAKNRFSHMIRRAGNLKGTAIVVNGSNNLIARNSIRDTDANAIRLGFGGVGNVVRSNHINGAGNDGVHVYAKKPQKHLLLKRNHVFGSKDDGINADAPTTKLTGNEARRNGDLGIEAVRGVIDGGGNKASGNGDPLQCINIVCR